MYQAGYIKHSLKFLKPAGTSRGVLLEKDSWMILVQRLDEAGKVGIGECSLIPGLSQDKLSDFEKTLEKVCERLSQGNLDFEFISEYPAIRFGLETALLDLESGAQKILFPSTFTDGKTGIPINGLIWMGTEKSIKEQIDQKIKQGFGILKLKVGALDFEEELGILTSIRKEYPASELEIRLDANGAWSADAAPAKLSQLAEFQIHSIEQPIAAGNPDAMANVCSNSPIPIALDEELIGVYDTGEKIKILETIKPDYLIIKPSLLGGFKSSGEWIALAEKQGAGWWVTSALESNLGLNAIAQWTATLDNPLPQGLGTGSLFSNNFPSPLEVREDRLFHLHEKNWDLSQLKI